jgi:predicted aspartyl protease
VSGEKIEIVSLLDTGFDGEILVPWKTYKELNLENCQFPDAFSQRGVTVSGEKKKLLSSPAKVELGHLTLYPAVKTFEDNKVSAIGRGFIEDFTTILNGSKKLLSIK